MQLKKSMSLIFVMFALNTMSVQAANYIIDTKGQHAFIDFKFKHLGISWLTGTFKKFNGKFSYDPANLNASSISVDIDPASLDSNHSERDKHIRGEKFLNVAKYPAAKFVSTRFEDKGNGKMIIHGDLTLHGVTRSIAINASKVGEGKDPWGGYRAGFEGSVTLDTTQFGMNNFKPLNQIEMYLSIEGIRQ